MTKHLELVDPYRTDVATNVPRKLVLCTDCRFSGWLSEGGFSDHPHPTHCLRAFGGGDHSTGERIIHGRGFKEPTKSDRSLWEVPGATPTTYSQNFDGECRDFQPVRVPWWRRIFRSRRRIRT